MPAIFVNVKTVDSTQNFYQGFVFFSSENFTKLLSSLLHRIFTTVLSSFLQPTLDNTHEFMLSNIKPKITVLCSLSLSEWVCRVLVDHICYGWVDGSSL